MLADIKVLIIIRSLRASDADVCKAHGKNMTAFMS